MDFKTQNYTLHSGISIQAFIDDELTKRILSPRGYEPDLSWFLKKYLIQLEDPICVDVGANIGVHTILMSRYSQKIYSFEPIPFIFEILEKNIHSNALQNVEPMNKGLSNESCKSTIYLNLDGNLGGSSIEHESSNSSHVDISLVRGDDLFSSKDIPQIDFIKIDVEGHEAKVCTGLADTIRLHRPIIALEWNSSQTRTDFESYNLFESLFKDYLILPLTDTHLNFRLVSRNEIMHKIFRKITRPLFNKFVSKKTCLGKFYECESYSNILIVPKEKVGVVIDMFA
jgi:FkbM family methyltransferase